jgi:hypothetical protein
MRRSKQHLYSITSSARTSNEGGTVGPSAFAGFTSITKAVPVRFESAGFPKG